MLEPVQGFVFVLWAVSNVAVITIANATLQLQKLVYPIPSQLPGKMFA